MQPCRRQECRRRTGRKPDRAKHCRCRQQQQSLDEVVPAVGTAERCARHEVADQCALCPLGGRHVQTQQQRDDPQRPRCIDQRQRHEQQCVQRPAGDQQRHSPDAIRQCRKRNRKQSRGCRDGRPQQRDLRRGHTESTRPQQHERIGCLTEREDREHEQHAPERRRQGRPAPLGAVRGGPLERRGLAKRERQRDAQHPRNHGPQQNVAHRHLQRQQACGEKRTDHGACIVERSMQSECQPALIGRHRTRQQGIAR